MVTATAAATGNDRRVRSAAGHRDRRAAEIRQILEMCALRPSPHDAAGGEALTRHTEQCPSTNRTKKSRNIEVHQ